MNIIIIRDLVYEEVTTKWPTNFRMILICYFFSVDAVLSSTTIPEVFIHASTLHSVF